VCYGKKPLTAANIVKASSAEGSSDGSNGSSSEVSNVRKLLELSFLILLFTLQGRFWISVLRIER
jgi:hypothetical protein